MQALLRLLKKAFIDPFTSTERAILYLCTFFGQFGFTGLLVYFAFDLTSLDLDAVLGFFTGKFFFSNLFFLPLLFIIVARARSAIVFSFLVLTQVIALLVLFLNRDLMSAGDFNQALLVGIIISFVTEPFWVIYHNMMLQLTTDENRGHEVSVAELGLQVGSAIGALAAGFMLTFMPGAIFPLFGSFSLIIPASILSVLSAQFFKEQGQKPSYLAPYSGAIQNPRLSLATLMQGVLEGVTTYYAPLWMKVLGFSAIVMSSLTSAKLAARFAIGPLTGHLFQKGNRKELRLGAYVYMISWIPWIILDPALAFVITAVIWSVYNHLIKVGLDGRWYANKTMEGMATREVCMGVGRLLALACVAPLIVISPLLFFAAAIGAGVLFLISTYILKK